MSTSRAGVGHRREQNRQLGSRFNGTASEPLPYSERDVEWCECSLPRFALPSGANADESHHGAVCTSPIAGDHSNRGVDNDDATVISQSRELNGPGAHSAALHCPAETPPM